MGKGIAHVALYTGEFEKTIQFYQDVFAARVMGYFSTNRRGCWLSIEGDILEIFESPQPPEGCFKHIAIACRDLQQVWERALHHGAQAYVPPKTLCLDFDPPIQAKIAFIQGINGEQIELFQQTEIS